VTRSQAAIDSAARAPRKDGQQMPNCDFASLLSAMERDARSYYVTLPDDWLQGRTAFGGLSAALCWEAIQ